VNRNRDNYREKVEGLAAQVWFIEIPLQIAYDFGMIALLTNPAAVDTIEQYRTIWVLFSLHVFISFCCETCVLIYQCYDRFVDNCFIKCIKVFFLATLSLIHLH
jgi:hypothetical protein